MALRGNETEKRCVYVCLCVREKDTVRELLGSDNETNNSTTGRNKFNDFTNVKYQRHPGYDQSENGGSVRLSGLNNMFPRNCVKWALMFVSSRVVGVLL